VITPSTGAPTTQTFDPAGNMIGANTGGALTTQTWSGENRMLSLQNSTGTNESYLYSQDGLRKEKTNSAGTTLFTWDEQNVLLETNTSGVLLARNTDFPGYWGGLASQNRGGVSSFFGVDSQGSVRILTSDLGAITDYYAYMAFGVELATGATTVNPNRYLGLYGYYRDFINWMYVRARLLDALRGRWINRDPIGYIGGDWNLYRYVRSNPIYLADPTGLACKIKYVNINPTKPQITSCGKEGCGTKMEIGYASITLCPGSKCDGVSISETVSSSGDLPSDMAVIITGPAFRVPNPPKIPPGNHDRYGICLDADQISLLAGLHQGKVGTPFTITETITQVLSADGVPFERCTITFTWSITFPSGPTNPKCTALQPVRSCVSLSDCGSAAIGGNGSSCPDF
jgi:RHS repeat-associated protein